MNKLQKFVTGTLIGAFVMTASASAVFAQTDETVEETSACVPIRGEHNHPLADALEELGLTREDVRDYDGTIQELLEENGVDVDVIIEEHQAEREAQMLECIDELEAEGTITAEQADTLRTAIADGTFREVITSEEFDGILPQFDGRGRGHRGRGRGGRAGFGWQFSDGTDAPVDDTQGDS